MARKKIFLFDIPASAGCLETGTELSPRHFRDNGIIPALRGAGFDVADLGAVAVPSGRRHNETPVRNWPMPRAAWRRAEAFIKKLPRGCGRGLLLCLGGDCSMITGAVSGMIGRLGADKIHVICLDGDADALAPDPETCVGAAAMGLWMLTHKSAFWRGKLPPGNITVIGAKKKPSAVSGIACVPLGELKSRGIARAARAALAAVAPCRKLFVHFDVDVLARDAMPAAYAPRRAGLSLCETEQILKLLLSDKRTVFLEISEFMPARDKSGAHARAIIALLCRALRGIKL
ncbi:MAG: arginase family protein [Elusimicrobiales bacterium]